MGKMVALFALTLAAFFAVNAPSVVAQEEAPFQGDFETWASRVESLRYTAEREISVSFKGQSRTRTDHWTIEKNKQGHLRYHKKKQGHLEEFELFISAQKTMRTQPSLSYDFLTTQNVILPMVYATSRHGKTFWQDFATLTHWEKKKTGEKLGKRLVDRYKIQGAGEQNFSVKGEIIVDQETGLVLKTNIQGQFEQEPEPNLHQKLNLPPFLVPLEESLKGPFLVKFTIEERVDSVNQDVRVDVPWLKEKTTQK